MKCAKKVANFLGMYQNVKLSIFAARLYYFRDERSRQGLLGLSDQGACLYRWILRDSGVHVLRTTFM